MWRNLLGILISYRVARGLFVGGRVAALLIALRYPFWTRAKRASSRSNAKPNAASQPK